MLVAILGLLDLLAALVIAFPSGVLSGLVVPLGLIMLFKGASSFLGSLLAGFPFDILGLIDLIVGAALVFSWSIPLLWFFPLVKGIFSVITGW